MSTHREPCTHGYLLWFDGEGGYWHDMHHTQQCDDPDASTKRFGAAPEQPIPPAYSLEELENAILQVLADNQIDEEEGRHPGFQAVVELNRKLEAAARLLREWHSSLSEIEEYWNRSENDRAMSDALNKMIDIAFAALAKVKT